jgi:hypothetical protein
MSGDIRPGCQELRHFRARKHRDPSSRETVGSSLLNEGSTAENWLRLVLVGLALFALATRKSLLPGATFLAVTYTRFPLAGMAFMEGNLGLAIRHKSSLLWSLCLSLALVGEHRNVRSRENRDRNRPSWANG